MLAEQISIRLDQRESVEKQPEANLVRRFQDAERYSLNVVYELDYACANRDFEKPRWWP